MTHDELIDRMFTEYQKADVAKYVDIFLSGLSHHKINLGMAALSYMRTFPKHEYCLLEDWILRKGPKAVQQQKKLKVLDRKVITIKEIPSELQDIVVKNDFFNGIDYHCEICAGYFNDKYPLSEKIINFYLDYGNLHVDNHLMLFWLEYTNSVADISKPTNEDYEIFQLILDCLRSSDDNENIRDILRKIKKQPFYKKWYNEIRKQKMDAQESTEYLSTRVDYKIQLILEMLGLCGVLHTDKVLGPFYVYDNIPMAARSNYKSDWEPPVDFWRGKNGIDENAFNFWFGSQPYKFIINK